MNKLNLGYCFPANEIFAPVFTFAQMKEIAEPVGSFLNQFGYDGCSDLELYGLFKCRVIEGRPSLISQ